MPVVNDTMVLGILSTSEAVATSTSECAHRNLRTPTTNRHPNIYYTTFLSRIRVSIGSIPIPVELRLQFTNISPAQQQPHFAVNLKTGLAEIL